ncbi:hypothetical protein [Cryptosporangium arvum]|uniref:hypothetical protein n=1 Tax=Cryptosporangium arvum TaxID=80871 RepID=UPI0004B98404|nr:hypothetical protein [Cryptosporangium arvum]
MRTLRRVVGEQPLILAWTLGTTLTLLFAEWLLEPFFPVVVALGFGALVLVVLLTLRDVVDGRLIAESGLAELAERSDRADADLREVRGRVRIGEEARREVAELTERVSRLETVLSLLTRWPREVAGSPVTNTVQFRPSTERNGSSARDDLARFRGRRAAQERGRKRVERWRTQLGGGPDRLAVYVDVFWVASSEGPMLVIRRTRMSAPDWGSGPEYLLAMEERFADARARREVAFWSVPAGEDLGRLVSRLAADQDRWQDLADGLPAVVREGDGDRLGPATSAELEALVQADEPVRIVRYTAVLEGVTTAEPAFRRASVVHTEGDPVAALVADAFVRVLDGMSVEPGEPAGADATLGDAATAGIARWHGTDGLRADARSVLDQRRRRGTEPARHAAVEPRHHRRPRHGVPG